MRKLEGVIVSIITPFQDDQIDFQALERNILKLNKTRISGYLILGGNAESQSMTEEERNEIVSFISRRKEDKLLLTGIYSESSLHTLNTIERYSKYDIDYIRLAPPHYFPRIVDQNLLHKFYSEIADNSPIPLVLYNAPKLTGGITISTELAAALSENPMISGIKDSSLTGLYKFINIQRNNPHFKILAGSASFFFPALMAGADGGDMTAANYLPEACCRLYKCVKNGELQEAKELHEKLLSINSFVSDNWGFCGVKTAMKLTGFDGGEPRRPFSLPDSYSENRIKELLVKEGFLQ